MLRSSARHSVVTRLLHHQYTALHSPFRRPSTSSLISPSYLIGPSSLLFSTSSHSSTYTKKRITPAKLEKLDKKRVLRAERKVDEERREELRRIKEVHKFEERERKRIDAQELTEDLPPITDTELESIYLGLIQARPEDLATPTSGSITGPSEQALLLGEPNDPSDREAGLIRLAERLEQFEEEEVNDDREAENVESGLAKKLKERRTNEQPMSATIELEKPNGLLDRLERMLDSLPSISTPESSTADLETSDQPARGLIHKSEWRDLILTSAHDGDHDAVKRGILLMQRMTPMSDAQILTDLMKFYAEEERPRDAIELATFAREHSLPLSVVSHHHLLSCLAPNHPDLALQHLHSIETAGYTPLLSTYTLLISRLLSPSSPPHLISRGWDLYAHCRLVSHPIPSAQLYTTMISACSRGLQPSPERAVDLFIEMTETNDIAPSSETYNALIRACAREGSQDLYFEALRYMKQMLDRNLLPNRATFNALLEGARKNGDLARARWILVKMVEIGREAAPDASSLGLVFRAYKEYKPEKREKNILVREHVKVVEPEKIEGSAEKKDDGVKKSNEPPIEEPNAIRMIGDSDFMYPGPLPTSSDEIVAEARNLMLQCVDSSLLSPSTDLAQDSRKPTSFPNVVATAFLFNSYLELLAAHAPFPSSIEFYDTAYERRSIMKNAFTFETMMHRCETAKNRDLALEIARRTFDQWKTWTEEDQERLDGRNISRMWSSMIRNLARCFKHVEALSLLQRFISTYPPLALIASAKVAVESRKSLPSHPTRVQLSSPAFPETTTRSKNGSERLPPHILYDDIKLLYLRFANLEDEIAIKKIKGITKIYSRALAEAKGILEGRVKQHGKKSKKRKGST